MMVKVQMIESEIREALRSFIQKKYGIVVDAGALRSR